MGDALGAGKGAATEAGSGARADARRSALVETLVVVVVAVVYFSTAARHVLGGDAGEFDTLFFRGGVAHPPGYPLYVSWLRAFRWLPASSPAHGASLATAILGVGAVALLQRACRAWGARVEVAAIASLVFALSPLAWSLATSAEAFALNALLAAAILWFSAPSAPLRGARATFVLGLLAGLGLSDHHTIVLLLPVGLYAALRNVRASEAKASAVIVGVLGLALGLVPYAVLWFAARGGGWSWGDTSSLSGVVHHFLRSDYGTTQLQAGGGRRAPLAHLGAFLFRALLDLPAFLVVAIVAAFVRPPARGHRASLVALFASFVLAGPLFVMLFNARLDNVGAVIVERFYLLPEVVLAVLGAVAVEALLGARSTTPRKTSLIWVVGALVVGGETLRSVPFVREHHRPSVELYVRNTLSFLPPNAVVLGRGDHRVGGFLYAREVLGLRTDVAFVNPSMLGAAWYRGYASSIVGLPIDATPPGDDADVALARSLLAQGRPVFAAATPNEAMQSAFASFPIGTVTQLLPRGAPLPDPVSLMHANEAIFARFTFEPTPPPSPRTWAGNLQLSYARPWTVLAVAFSHMGDHEREATCAARARAYVPWIESAQ